MVVCVLHVRRRYSLNFITTCFFSCPTHFEGDIIQGNMSFEQAVNAGKFLILVIVLACNA